MDGTKPALASKGVWGSIIALAALILPAVLAQVGALTPDQLKAIGLPTYVASLAGIILALYGRLSARDTIAGVASTPSPTVLRAVAPLLAVGFTALLIAGSLTACAGGPQPLPSAPVVSLSAPDAVRVRQAVDELRVAQHALLVARDQADAHGLLKGDLRARVFAATRRGGPVDAAVRGVSSAGTAVTAATFQAQVAAAYAAIADVRALVPNH